MLIGFPTKQGTGIELQGESLDFESLYNSIHTICSKIENNPETTLFLEVAYDIRKTLQLKKSLIKKEDGSKYLALKINWPNFLLTIKFLEGNARIYKNEYEIIANIARLHHIAIKALLDYDKKIGKFLVNWLNKSRISVEHLAVIKEKVIFDILLTPGGIIRFRRTQQILNVFVEESASRESFREELANFALKNNCNIDQLGINSDSWDSLHFKW
jgi:hypothetical protein